MTSKDNCHVEAPPPPTPLDILCRQALARSQDDFEALFNTINDLLFVLDPDGVMIHVNQVACRRLGYGEAELVGRPFLSIYSPDLRDEAARLVTAVPADFCLVPIVARDGTEIPVETRIVQGEWNGKLALFAVVKDMSLLKQSEELFSWSFHSNPVLMAVSSLSDDRFIKVNEVFLTTLGYPLSEVVGKTAGELRIMVDPCTRAEVLEMLEREGRARGVETRVRCKDGTIRHGLFSADRIMSGNAPCLLTTMVDITPLKQTEKTLLEERRKLVAIIYNTRVGTWEWNVQTGATVFSERWAEIIGYTLEELSPTSIDTWAKFTHPDDLETSYALMEKHFRGELDYYECEVRMKHRNGSWVWVLDRGRVTDWTQEGRPFLVMGTHQDITDRKLNEQALVDNMQEMQEARDWLIQFEKEAAVGRLVAGVAHELLNPVSIISSRLQFMQEEPLPCEALEGVRICREQLKRIVTISQKLNQLSPSPPMVQLICDLREVIALSLIISESRTREEQVSVVYTPPLARIPVKMGMDGLLKLMTHLIFNACDALCRTEEKRLLITVQSTIGTDKPASVRVIVADNGCGVAAGEMNRIFDPFFTTKDTGKGTGLGLTICRNIVSLHKGTLCVENNDLGGASFIVELPLSDE